MATILLFLTSGYSKAQTGLCELSIDQAWLSTSGSLQISESGYVSARFKNSGSVKSCYTSIGIYLSADTTKDLSDRYLGDINISPLDTNKISIQQGSYFYFPDDVQPGDYYMLLLIDHYQFCPETNENNNSKYLSVTIDSKQSDVAVSKANFTGNTMVRGATFSGNFTHFNLGNVTANNVGYGIYLSTDTILDNTDYIMNNQLTSILYKNAALTTYFSFLVPDYLPIADYYVLVSTDISNSIVESNEINNTSSIPVTLTLPSYDLEMLSQQTPAVQVRNTPISLRWEVKNNSNIAVPGSILAFYLSTDNIYDSTDVLIGSTNLYTINPGATTIYFTDLSLSQSLAVGTYYVFYKTDYANSYNETNESNNILGSGPVVYVDNTIDLFTTQLSIPNASQLIQGSIFRLDYIKKNSGNTRSGQQAIAAYISLDTLVDPSDQLLYEYLTYDQLASSSTNSYYDYQLPVGYGPGNYYILQYVDVTNLNTETNENNNVSYVPVTIIDGIIVPSAGNKTVYACTGKAYDNGGFGNIGTSQEATLTIYPSTPGSFVKLDFSQFALGNKELTIYDNNTASGTKATLYSYSYPPTSVYATNATGALTLKVSSGEPGFGNNTGFVADISCLSSLPAPDLTIAYNYLSIQSFFAESEFFVNTTIINTSYTDITTSTSARVYLSTDNVIDGADVLLATATIGAIEAKRDRTIQFTNVKLPAGLTPGAYKLIILLNPDFTLTETTYTNNVSIAPITVLSKYIDFTFSSAPSPVSTHVRAGGTITVNTRLTNIGTIATAGSTIGYAISRDEVLSAGDIFMGQSYGPSLTGNGSRVVDLVVPITDTLSTGEYYLLAIADPFKTETESDETNNVSSVKIYIQQPFINLRTLSIYNTHVISPGGSANLSFRTYNGGNIACGKGSSGVYFSSDQIWDVNDQQMFLQEFNSIAAGSEVYFNANTPPIPANTLPGIYYLIYISDVENTIDESIETDNINVVGVVVETRMAELLVKSVTVTNQYLIAGSQASIQAVIQNDGNTDVNQSFATNYYLSRDGQIDATDILLATQNLTYLNAGSNYTQYITVSIPDTVSIANYFLIVVTDEQNQITERFENNNRYILPLRTVSQSVDILVSRLSLSSSALSAGKSMSLYADLVNIGNIVYPSANVKAYLSSDMNFDPSDLLMASSSISQLYVNGNTTANLYATIPTSISPGLYYVIFVVDPGNLIAESNKTNNISVASLMVLPNTYDLELFSMSSARTILPNGSTNWFYTNIRNNGNSNTKPSRIGYYLSKDASLDSGDLLVGSNSIEAIQYGSIKGISTDVTIPDTLSPGSYYIFGVADDTSGISETSEINNSRFIAITVVAAAYDLSFSSISNPSLSVVAGYPRWLSGYVSNKGNMNSHRCAIKIYISSDTVLDVSDRFLVNYNLDVVNANTTLNFSINNVMIPSDLAIGSYYILYKVDEDNKNTESNEDNNLAYTNLTIVAPVIDISMSTYYVAPTTIIKGAAMAYNLTPVATGTIPAYYVKTSYYLSTDSALSANDARFDLRSLTLGNNNWSSYYIRDTVAAGDYFIIIKLDSDDAYAETDETNNIIIKRIKVEDRTIDIKPENITLPTTTVLDHATLSYGVMIYNRGYSYMSATSNVTFYLSKDNLLDGLDVLLQTSTIGNIYASNATYIYGSYPITSPTFAEGTYYLLVIVDDINTISESDESNNFITQSIIVEKQYTYIPVSGTSTITSCDLFISTVENTPGFYANNADGVLVIKPATDSYIQVALSNFEVEYCCDYFAVYNGSSMEAPLLGKYSGTSAPQTFTASNNEGALTLYFTSNLSGTGSGIKGHVSCTGTRIPTEVATMELATNSFQVFPNPSNGEVYLSTGKTQERNACTISLINILGEEVWKKEFGSGNLQNYFVNFSSFPAGMYTVLYKSEKERGQIKITIEK